MFSPKVFIYFLGSLAALIMGTVLLALMNDVLATKTVLDTYPGTKTVCARQQYNYSLKITQCVENRTVAATCKTVESDGPIFDPIISTRCE